MFLTHKHTTTSSSPPSSLVAPCFVYSFLMPLLDLTLVSSSFPSFFFFLWVGPWFAERPPASIDSSMMIHRCIMWNTDKSPFIQYSTSSSLSLRLVRARIVDLICRQGRAKARARSKHELVGSRFSCHPLTKDVDR
jgi:hypothetical protein